MIGPSKARRAGGMPAYVSLRLQFDETKQEDREFSSRKNGPNAQNIEEHAQKPGETPT
jgi:hypothetical protein